MQRSAVLHEPQIMHIPVKLELVCSRALQVEPCERAARGYGCGSREDDLDAISLQMCAYERAVRVGANLRYQARALPKPAERDSDIGGTTTWVDGEVIATAPGDHVNQRLTNDSDHVGSPRPVHPEPARPSSAEASELSTIRLFA